MDAENLATHRASALDWLRQGLAKTEENVFLLWNIVEPLIEAGHYEEAQQWIEKLEKKAEYRSPMVPPKKTAARYLRAQLAFAREQWPEAIEGFEAARPGLAGFSKASAMANTRLAECHRRLGNHDMELEAYQRVLSSDRFNPQALTGITNAAIRSGKIDEAVKHFDTIMRIRNQKPAVENQLLFVKLLIEQNRRRDPDDRDWRKPEAVLAQIAQEDPNSVDVPLLRAEILKAQDRAGEAQALVLEARKRNPQDTRLWKSLVAAAQKQEDWDRVEALLAEVEKSTGDVVVLRLARAENLAKRYGKDGIARMKRLANNIDRFSKDESWALLNSLASWAMGYGEWDRAEELLDQAKQKEGDTLRMRAAMAGYLSNRHRDKAGSQLKELADNADHLPEADQLQLWGLLMRYAIQTGDGEQARELGRRILEKKPERVDVRLQLFDLASVEKNDDAMLKLLDEIKEAEGEGVEWHYGKAKRLIMQAEGPDDKKLDDALKHLVQAEKERPSWPPLPLAKGAVYQRKQDAQKALENWLKAFNLGARNPAAIEQAVRLLFAEERYAEALKLARSLEQRGILPSPQFARLLILLKQQAQDYTGALDLARRVASGSEEYMDHLQFGDKLWIVANQRMREGDETGAAEMFDEVEKALRRAVELSDDVAATWRALISFLAKQGKTQEAEKAIAEAQTKIPADEVAMATASWYALLGRAPRAEQMYMQALKATPKDPAVVRAVADFYMKTEQFLKAEKLLKQFYDGTLKATQADARQARRLMARILIDRGGFQNRQKALALIEKNKTGESVSPADRRLLVELLPAERRSETIKILESQAREAERQGSTPSPEDQFLLAKLYESTGAWNKTEQVMTQLLGRIGDDPALENKFKSYVDTYVKWLIRYKMFSAADVWLSKLETMAPNHFAVSQRRVEWLFRAGRYADAFKLAKDFVENQKEDVVPSKREDRMRVVAQTLEQSLQLLDDPNSEDPAQKAVVQQYLAAAESLLVNYIRLRPGQEMLLASFYARQGRLDNALTVIENAWDRCIEEHFLAQTLSAFLKHPEITADQTKRGLTILESALKKFDRPIPLLRLLGEIRTNQEDYAAAEAAYREVLAADKENWIAMNNLAVLLALRKTKLDEALMLIESAISIRGPIGAMRDSRASVYLARKDSAKALADLKRAITLDPTATKYFHLAQAHQLARNDSEAVKAMKKAVDLKLKRDDLHPLEVSAYDKLRKLVK